MLTEFKEYLMSLSDEDLSNFTKEEILKLSGSFFYGIGIIMDNLPKPDEVLDVYSEVLSEKNL